MPNFNNNRRGIVDFILYELKYMLTGAVDEHHVPAPDMNCALITHLTKDQKDELAAKLIDLAKFIRATP